MGNLSSLRKSHNLFATFIIIIGVLLFLMHFSFSMPLTNGFQLGLLVIAIILLNIFMIYLPPKDNRLCLDTTVYLSVMYLYGIEITLQILLISTILYYIVQHSTNWITDGTEWWKHIVNFGMYNWIIIGAYYAFIYTGGEIGLFGLNYAHAYIISTAVYYIVNIFIVTSYFAMANDTNMFSIAKSIAEDSFFHYLATLILSYILLILMGTHPIFGLLIFMIINVLVSIAFKNYFNMYEQAKKDKTYREQILDSLPVGIITSDDTLNEFFLNSTAKELLQIEEKDVKPHLYKDQEFWKVIYSRDLCHNKNVKHNDRLFLLSQSELKNKKEQLIGRIIHFIDMTEIEEMQRKINQTEKLALLGEMSAGAAHEIRNPLTVISGFLTLMKQSFTKENNERYQLPLLLKELERINTIVEDMLTVARPASPQLMRMSIKEILNELPKNLLLNDSMHVAIQLDDTKLLVDPKQMKQVLYNLIRNSVEAMDGLGRLSIYSVKKEQTYEIYIKDSGTGMDEATVKTVFNPFFTSKETGTGLGLTIVQRIIDDHHGKIEVFETSENGTTFLITLPLQD
ncbi:hypothetical protein BC6307_21840 [Sutcliffiella cohnii]|uniref:histidine kinase n=2 Tax=Sutcliffiella cohnii TaxID=33932 RepID=A0A223KW94_9BACI|nr:hypothetical protein BC6307_21840 [Sutcliffiella cohnii]